MRTLLATLLACALGLSAAPSLANKPETPTTTIGAKVISVDEGKAFAAGKTATFIDTRSPINVGKGRIPGAVIVACKEENEPNATFDASQDAFPLDKLPADKKARIVFYSDGPTGWKSYKAALLAVEGRLLERDVHAQRLRRVGDPRSAGGALTHRCQPELQP